MADVAPTFLNHFFYEFVTLFVILDPVATIPIYLSVTAGLDRRTALLVAFYALGVSVLILLFFIVIGQSLLSALHIPMASFQMAGSLVLLLFGLKMVLGKVTEEAMSLPHDATPLQRAVFPLAVPGIAGAGAILTVVLLTDNKVRTLAEQATTTTILVMCLAIFFAIYATAGAVPAARQAGRRDREPGVRPDPLEHRRDRPDRGAQAQLRADVTA